MNEFLRNLDPFWAWLGVAAIALSVEVLIVPGGFFLCFGTAAAIIAALLFFLPDLSPLWTLSLFAPALVLTGVGWWKLLRKGGDRIIAGEGDGKLNVKTEQLVGYSAVLAEDMKGGRGRLRVNDSPWPAVADEDYPAGTRVEVTAVEGITLRIRAAG